jgi:hypothetical protein
MLTDTFGCENIIKIYSILKGIEVLIKKWLKEFFSESQK